jgi:hypothetical protein
MLLRQTLRQGAQSESNEVFDRAETAQCLPRSVAYGVVAWFLTQLTTQVFPFFEIPNSAVRFVVIALAIGSPRCRMYFLGRSYQCIRPLLRELLMTYLQSNVSPRVTYRTACF